MPHPSPPKIFAIALFPGFQLLDITGPLDVLNILSSSRPLTLHILAATLDPVPTQNHLQDAVGSSFSQSIVPTHTFATAPADIEVLIIPGGTGVRKEEHVRPVVEFLRERYEGLRWCLTVCTGSAVLAGAGVLDGRRATSNKRAFAWVKEQNAAVNWVAKARWVVDGSTWTSSGISAGIDLIYAWVGEVYGEEIAKELADRSEYERNTDSESDRFAERWGAV